jgi:hypothetical protein
MHKYTRNQKDGSSRFGKAVTAEKRRGMEDSKCSSAFKYPSMSETYARVKPQDTTKWSDNPVSTPPKHNGGKNGAGKGFHGK